MSPYVSIRYKNKQKYFLLLLNNHFQNIDEQAAFSSKVFQIFHLTVHACIAVKTYVLAVR